MTASTDHELLAEFARNESEEAFATLVTRHINLVYSAALRSTGNPHHAQEITQAVFIILARKAGKLSPRVVLSGWLYQTARLTAANFMKGERRRQRRELEAFMQSTLNETDSAAWERIAPLLDEAMGRLSKTDRDAVVLRYFENKTAAETAIVLRTTEAAAHKRVHRALAKLRKLFSRRGVTMSAIVIAGAISTNSVQATPVGMAAMVTGTAATGSAISAVVSTLVNGTVKTMTWLKLKFAAGVCAAVLLVGGMATVTVSQLRNAESGAALQVDGSISRARPGATPEPFCYFSIVVSGEKSLIRVQYFNGESFACGTDGHDSYLLNEMKPARAKDPNVMEFGEISAGPYPNRAPAPIQLLWLAYASAAQLNRGGGDWPLEGAAGDSASVSNEVRRWTQSPGLPQDIKWWASGNEVVAGQTNYLVEYPDGYLAGAFSADAPVNLEGDHDRIPLTWTCTWYTPRNRDSADSSELAQAIRDTGTLIRTRDDVEAGGTLECRATNVVVLPDYQGTFLPELGTNVNLTDYRFEKEVGEGIVIPRRAIPSSNGKVIADPEFKWTWPRRNDPHLLRMVRARRAAKRTK